MTSTSDSVRLKRRLGRCLAATVAAVSLTVAVPAHAADAPNTGRISFSAGSDVTTAYFFRGILQEREGLIWQPYGEVNLNLYKYEEENNPFNNFSFGVFVGNWNSVQTKQTLASGSGPGNWYESDVYAGAKANIFGNTEAKVYYIAYSYPGGAFKTVQEVDAQVSLNDSQWLDKWALYPYGLIAGEFDNTALGTKEGSYGEFGIRPSFTLIDNESYPLSMAVPMKVGISIADYYESASGKNYTFGYFAGGPVFTVPLAFIPTEYGAWTTSLGAQVYAFGTSTKQYNRNDGSWVVGTWSVNFSY